MMHRIAWRSGRVVVAVTVGAWLAAAPALAQPPESPGTPLTAARHVVVQTYNVDLGANLAPVFNAKTLPELVAAAAKAWGEVQQNDFPLRATALGALIAAERPDVIGLQEVARWDLSTNGGQTFTTVYDYLQLLLDDLATRGLAYMAVATNDSFIGMAPIVLPPVQVVRYTDRNVVLVRADLPSRMLQAANPMQHTYIAGIERNVPLPPPQNYLFISRGWASADVTVWGKTFRFVTTHLEAYSEVVRNLQADELVALLAASPYPVVVTGDMNSRPTGCDNVNTVAYGKIVASGLVEAWPMVHQQTPCTGVTSGQISLVDPTNNLDHRIDDIFFSPASFTAILADVVGDTQAERTAPTEYAPYGFWPSDHASSVATLRTTSWQPKG